MTLVEVKTAELIGPALDYAVAKAVGDFIGSPNLSERENVLRWAEHYASVRYSTDWSQGGPLIEQREIELHVLPQLLDMEAHPTFKPGDTWEANIWPCSEDLIQICGPTPLIAAMRCLVAAKLGDTVQVPKELLP